jgi:glycosyltransferase involved in cell wall biosynthesis
MKTISVVSGCFNEEGNLREFYERVKAALAKFPRYDYEIIVADNRSTDGSGAILRELAAKDRRFKVIFNSRNFGPVTSGYNAFLQAKGDAVVLMSSDLQDPPEKIADLLGKWEEGHQVVLAVRSGSAENPLMALSRRLYYKALSLFADNDWVVEKLHRLRPLRPKVHGRLEALPRPRPLFPRLRRRDRLQADDGGLRPGQEAERALQA